jgi:hypothetical protein
VELAISKAASVPTAGFNNSMRTHHLRKETKAETTASVIFTRSGLDGFSPKAVPDIIWRWRLASNRPTLTLGRASVGYQAGIQWHHRRSSPESIS